MTVDPALLHIDLCLLSYQIYHQSVIWPMDPWYEFVAHKGSKRRERFMEKIHEACAVGPGAFGNNGVYSGPGSLRGGVSNVNLDPIITNYHLIDPRLPVFNHDDSVFLSMQVPDYILGTIRNVSLSVYTHLPINNDLGTRRIINFPAYNVAGHDHLIAFEGGTGAYTNGAWTDQNAPAWSLMGYVLRRVRPGQNNGHDIHIVFRGSRSGNAIRAALEGATKHRGNPDWVTDTDSPLTRNTHVSRHGEVHQGFSRSVMTCLGTIKSALRKMHQLYGVPRSITITGHSLGAGLAVMLSSVLTLGDLKDRMRDANHGLDTWPWHEMRGYYMAQPPTGDAVFERHFNAHVAGCAPYVIGDAVVECADKKKAHSGMGKAMSLAAKGRQVTGFVKMPKPTGADGGENPHEVYLIRTALRTVTGDDPLTDQTPWACYRTFRKLLHNNPFTLVAPNASRPSLITRDNLKAILVNFRFTEHLRIYLATLEGILEENQIYGVYTKEETRRQKRAAMQLGRQRLNVLPQAQSMDVVQLRSQQIHNQMSQAQGSGMARFLGLCAILSSFETSTVNSFQLTAFNNDQELMKSLDMSRSGK